MNLDSKQWFSGRRDGTGGRVQCLHWRSKPDVLPPIAMCRESSIGSTEHIFKLLIVLIFLYRSYIIVLAVEFIPIGYLHSHASE